MHLAHDPVQIRQDILREVFFPFSGLANGAGGAADARNMFYHKSSTGFASGAEITSSVDWVAERAAHLISHIMSQGAVVIDGIGIWNVDAVRYKGV